MNEHELFAAALEIDVPAERSAYLDRACGGDDPMRARIEALLRAHEQAGSFLAAPPLAGSATLDAPRPLEGPGTVIGPYKLLQAIGEGGMGTVFMAEQTHPVRRRVALKVIKAGMDTRQVLARFGAERQALALMDHPNIARVLDAGATETGRPYFVMELVKGVPITRYCDDRRLTLRERLELFVPVCQAVQHAHQKGVIHRDLKPSNILVAQYDGRPVPKAIDFGVAKATGPRLTDQTLYTEFGAVVGTLEYMSPEQAELNQLDIDTRSDVYSLGAILYELLTGSTPLGHERLKTAAFVEMLRIIREEDCPRPSMRLSTTEELPSIAACRQVEPRKLSGLVRGELDWIVMKALEKDRNRRYETSNSLAADLRRYLADEPVTACPPSAWYRFGKFARRNRAALATAAVVAASLVAVAVISVVYATEQARATREIKGLATDLGKERKSLRKSLSQSNRLLAVRNFDRGQAAFEKGEIGPGMLWMIESWRSAIAAGDPAWQHAARANLAAWRPHYPRLKAVLSHPMPVSGAVFSPDSRTVLSSSHDGTAQLWDAASGKKVGPSLQVGDQYPYMAFWPDGKTVLTWAETPRLWDAATGESRGLPLRLPPQFRMFRVAIRPEGKLVVMISEVNDADGTAVFWDAHHVVRLWDAVTGQPIGPPMRHAGRVEAVAFSPDGKTVLTGDVDGPARFWDAATGQPLGLSLKRPGGFTSAAFSPDGQTILTGSRDGTALLWDRATGQPIGPPMRNKDQVGLLAFSPDGKLVLTGCRDKEARLWDAATGQFIGLLQHQGSISAVAFSPDGKTILTGSTDGTVRLWDADPGQPVGQVLEIPSTEDLVLGANVGSISPDGRVLTSFAREPRPRYIQLWNATTRQPIARLPLPGGFRGVKFSPDGKILSTIAKDKTARLWDATTGAALGAPFPLPCPLMTAGNSFRLGPAGKTLLFASNDQRVWVCDGATGSVRGRTPALGGFPYGLEFSPDGKTFFTGLDNGEIRFWDAATVTPLGEPILQPNIGSGRFSRDGKTLLTASSDGSVRLWDLATRKLLIPPLRDQGPAEGVFAGVYAGEAFSPDGKSIATGSRDGTSRVWDTTTGQPIGPALRHPSKVAVAFLADGKTLFTQSTVVARLFPVPPDLPDELERVAAWVEVITGLRLDNQQGLIQVLDNAAWLERRERLMQLGGPPETGPDQRLDPILFGPDPTARAKSFIERKQWAAAEAAFDEAMRARPFNLAIVQERGELYAKRALWSEAAAYYATQAKQYPDVAPLHYGHVLSLLASGDEAGVRRACSELLDRYGRSSGSLTANDVAWYCVLAPDAVADRAAPVRLAQSAVDGAPAAAKPVYLNTLGAALYRAGRFQEAVSRLEEGIRGRGDESLPQDWVFLAMAHRQLGHDAEARGWLDRLRAYRPNERPKYDWNELEIRLLRREAEAVILYDPIFPTDPFAH
jgi:WD40 repeat protein/serine/threonine protein kinase/tetratricopeptide (TPR) repeat protein